MTHQITIDQHLDLRFDAGADVLRSRADDIVLDDVAGGTLELRAGTGDDDPRRVVASVDPPRDLDPHAVGVPLRLAAVDDPERFPTFRGTIELSALSDNPPQSQLALTGEVEPPAKLLARLGAAGKADLDEALDDLLERIATRLRDEAARRATVD